MEIITKNIISESEMRLYIFGVEDILITKNNVDIQYKYEDRLVSKSFDITFVKNNSRDYFFLSETSNKKYFLSTAKNIFKLEMKYENFAGDIFVFKIDEESYANIFSEKKEFKKEGDLIPFFENLLKTAFDVGATDIHIESLRDRGRIRFRIDGVLKEVENLDKNNTRPLIAIIKNISEMDIVNKRTPQDGRFSKIIDKNQIDFRVSTIPTIYGEKLEIRLLYKRGSNFNLDDIYLSPENKKFFDEALAKKSGMIILNGPTGSGKSTTLSVMIRLKNTEDVNISTVEDPIEYDIDGVNQVQCKNEIGLDFKNILRSLLRQDPDILVIGEIRDKETAEIAVKSALTGHLVMTTLHSKDTVSSISRLINLDVDKYMLSQVMLMVISQRLVRKLCPHCKKNENEQDVNIKLKNLGLGENEIEKIKKKNFYSSHGCKHCFNTGYRGRIPVMEIMYVDDEIREMIVGGFDDNLIRKKMREKNMKSIIHDAIYKAELGLVSLDEIKRQL